MRSKRSDRYADENEEEDLSAKTPVQKGKRSKERSIEDELEAIEEQFYGLDNGRKKKKSKKPAPKIVEQPPQHRLEIPEFISVQNMAQALNVRLETFMQKLEEEGFEGARYDHLLDSGTASMFAELYGFDPVLATAEAQRDLVARPPAEDPSVLPPRPPIVTIMGHVDHGKTTILDYLRKANVVASEHGGITQHIGAFSVTMPGTQRTITFLDTPGHAAFLDMRRRGANVTDIVVLVVAADDSVKPQTEEAIKHALDANVQVIVAINKVDKEDANVDRVKQDLSRFDITVEDYGGDYQAIALSGKTGQGMAQLEEAIITLADVSDYRAEIDGPAEGWIIESKVTSAGRVATVLVRRGTLRPGDFIVAGNTWARVRTLRNDQGDVVSEAPPGTPVQIDGWRGEDPTAGLEVLQANDEQHAKQVVDLRLEKSEALRDATDMAAINAARSEAAEARAKVLAWQSEQGFASRKQARVRLRDSRTGWLAADESGPAKVHFVVKADVAGSVEALVAAISSIGNKEIQANIIHSGTGQISESDIRMLAATGEVGYAVSFNQPVDGTMYRLAEAAGLEVLDHNVIYKMTDVVTEKVAAELPPLVTTKVLGEAEIGQIFDVTIKKVKHKIAGCKITNGTISRSHKVRVIRGGDVVYTGSLNSLKNVKKDVTEMRKGSECGIAFDEWEEMQEGDKVQCFEEISEKRKLY
ncbi:translation initiation factor IF-2 [Cyphellophora europaea CBS 101466]|uniref:Translation initiation factor IF-2, mitochondrial n=1 Tax=Cyphellophora europaea (strain CBS 101466) TaxID=1220924 RepID=W2RQE7_CYPE1|nr:translation initiation factor IF-2 [Cyphellophora europaea CBS 101466]ETN37918.1 translation initiation factor IF-2 [Cyphellophora europaea CBS 101466]